MMAAREALQPLSLAYFFDAYESGGLIQFVPARADRLARHGHARRSGRDRQRTPLYTLTRGQETELPLSAKITFVNETKDYAQGRGRGAAAQCAERPGLGG